MCGSVKQIKYSEVPPKKQKDNPFPNVKKLTDDQAAIDISSDEDRSDTEPDDSNLTILLMRWWMMLLMKVLEKLLNICHLLKVVHLIMV